MLPEDALNQYIKHDAGDDVPEEHDGNPIQNQEHESLAGGAFMNGEADPTMARFAPDELPRQKGRRADEQEGGHKEKVPAGAH